MTSLSSIVRKVLTIDPSAPALEYNKKWHTWGELTAIIDGIEAILATNAIGPGTRIGGILRNTPQIAAVITGIIINDRCVVTLNPTLPEAKLVGDIVAFLGALTGPFPQQTMPRLPPTLFSWSSAPPPMKKASISRATSTWGRKHQRSTKRARVPRA
jgi:hypothetical protein